MGQPGMGAGFFGKLPGQGDFLNRRLPQEFLRVWDPWLQASLAGSREALAEGWLDAYLTSPVWRFVLAERIAGPGPWAGLLMPSVDRVGRHFPLTLACELPRGANPFECLSSAAEWFDAAERVMIDALEGSLSADAFDARVIALGLPALEAVDTAAEQAGLAGSGSGWRVDLERPAHLPRLLPRLLDRVIAETGGPYGLWWSQGSDRIEPSLLVRSGLPKGAAFTALYTGDWAHGDWRELAAAALGPLPGDPK